MSRECPNAKYHVACLATAEPKGSLWGSSAKPSMRCSLREQRASPPVVYKRDKGENGNRFVPHEVQRSLQHLVHLCIIFYGNNLVLLFTVSRGCSQGIFSPSVYSRSKFH
jgi:hypothetical protein